MTLIKGEVPPKVAGTLNKFKLLEGVLKSKTVEIAIYLLVDAIRDRGIEEVLQSDRTRIEPFFHLRSFKSCMDGTICDLISVKSIQKKQ